MPNGTTSGDALRRKVCDIINAWDGGAKGSEQHYDILNTYNGHKPLARGYAVKPNDYYCATTVSAAFIRAGIAEYTGTECSCYYFVEEAKKRGIWVENDAHIPKLGEACVYDWQDNGKGDNTGMPDHIGIVTAVSFAGGTFTVTEGNLNGGRIGKRTMRIDGKFIRGFICPDYDAIAAKLGGSASAPAQTPEVAAKLDYAQKYDKGRAGAYKTTADLNLRAGASTKKAVLAVMPKGATVQNYGYYSVAADGTPWLYVQYAAGGKTIEGFCSAKYLAKAR